MYGIRKTSMFSEKSDHECPVLHAGIFKLRAMAVKAVFLLKMARIRKYRIDFQVPDSACF